MPAELQSEFPSDLVEEHALAVHSVVARYAMAVACVLVAFGIRLALSPLLDGRVALIIFLPPALVAAWYGGWGPGLVALLGGLMIGDYFFMPPPHRLYPLRSEDFTLLIIHAVTTGICLVAIDRLHWTRGQAEKIRLTAQKLRLEMAERRRAELELTQAKTRLDLALEAASLCTWDLDLRSRELEITCDHESLMGEDYKSYHGPVRNLIRAVLPKDLKRLRHAIVKSIRERGPCEVEFRVRQADGSIQWLLCKGQVFRQPDGAVERMGGILMEITRRKQAAMELENTLSLLSTTLESTADGILVVDLNGRVVSHNRKFAVMWRIPGELLATGDDARILNYVLEQLAEPEAFLRRVQELMSQPEAEAEDEWHFKDGRVFARSSQPHRVGGKVVGRVWSFRDVTARKRVEEELRASEARFHELADAMPQIVWTALPDGRIEYLNRKWFEYSGLPREATFSCADWQKLMPAGDVEPALAAMTHAWRTGEPLRVEFRLQQQDNGYRWHLCRALPARDESGRIFRWFATFTDIEDRKRVEHDLQQTRDELAHYAQNLERRVAERTARLEETIRSLEGVLYHVAHDLRAPLRTMAGYTQLLRETQAPRLDEEGRDFAEHIVAAAFRMDRLILDLLAYGRLGHMRSVIGHVDLGRQVEGVLLWMDREIRGRNAEVRVEQPMPAVQGDPELLKVALAQLLQNALTFVAAGVAPRIHLWAEPRGDRIRLWVEDNGIGIDPAYRERIFRVFERLHELDQDAGTGIGLAMVFKAMERMGGLVGVEPNPGGGSRFWIELPRD